jgi:hypothetical protein
VFRIKFAWVIVLLLPLGLNCPAKGLGTFADTLDNKNLVTLDVGGPAGYWAIGYERTIVKQQNWRMFSSLAASFWNFEDYNGNLNPNLSVPFGIGTLYGGSSHKLEMVLSNTLYSIAAAEGRVEEGRKFGMNGNLHIGYRYCKLHTRWNIRVYYLGVLVSYEHFVNYGGLGIGFSF